MRWAADLRYNYPDADGAVPGPGTSTREPGFLARSSQRPDDVITDYRDFAANRSSDPAETVEAVQELSIAERRDGGG